MSLRWLTIFLDFPAGSYDAGVAFWREVTGYGLSAARGADGEFATLLPPSGDAYLRVQRIADSAGGCHLDVHVDADAESLTVAADRAVAAGALIRHREDGGQEARPAPGYYSLTRPAGWPARLLLQRRDSAAPGDRTRGHVDFGCTDQEARDTHVALGARVTGAQEYWTVLTDPAGREYCLVGRDPA